MIGDQTSSGNLLMVRFLPKDFKNFIKNFFRSLCLELRRYLLWTEKSVFSIIAVPFSSTLVEYFSMYIFMKINLKNVNHFYQKMAWRLLVAFFILGKKNFFRENTDFLKTGTRYRFQSSKFRFAVKSYIWFIKVTLIVLKEDFGLFLVRYLHMTVFLFHWEC